MRAATTRIRTTHARATERGIFDARQGNNGAALVREALERQERQFREQLESERQHRQEILEERRQADERIRQLEKERDAERFKRLEEKIEASAEKEENPSTFDFKTVVGQAVVKAVERGDDEIANSLIGTLKEGDGDAGSGWGFLRGVMGDVIEAARENPQGALQIISTAAQSLRGGAAMSPPPQPVAPPPPQPQPTPAQPQPPEVSDTQLLSGVAQELGANVIGDSDPTYSARLVRDVLTERPYLRETVEQIFRQGDEELLSSLSAMTGVSFDGLGRKPLKWVRDFRKALKAYGIDAELQAEEVAPHVASNNGNLAQAAEV